MILFVAGRHWVFAVMLLHLRFFHWEYRAPREAAIISRRPPAPAAYATMFAHAIPKPPFACRRHVQARCIKDISAIFRRAVRLLQEYHFIYATRKMMMMRRGHAWCWGSASSRRYQRADNFHATLLRYTSQQEVTLAFTILAPANAALLSTPERGIDARVSAFTAIHGLGRPHYRRDAGRHLYFRFRHYTPSL